MDEAPHNVDQTEITHASTDDVDDSLARPKKSGDVPAGEDKVGEEDEKDPEYRGDCEILDDLGLGLLDECEDREIDQWDPLQEESDGLANCGSFCF